MPGLADFGFVGHFAQGHGFAHIAACGTRLADLRPADGADILSGWFAVVSGAAGDRRLDFGGRPEALWHLVQCDAQDRQVLRAKTAERGSHTGLRPARTFSATVSATPCCARPVQVPDEDQALIAARVTPAPPHRLRFATIRKVCVFDHHVGRRHRLARCHNRTCCTEVAQAVARLRDTSAPTGHGSHPVAGGRSFRPFARLVSQQG